MSRRRGVDDADGLTSIDLLDEIRAALGLEDRSLPEHVQGFGGLAVR